MESKTDSVTLGNLNTETDGWANEKLKEIHSLYAENHIYNLKPSDDQRKVLSKEQKVIITTNLEDELIDPTNGIEELKGEIKAPSKTLDERETRLDSLEKEVEENKKIQEIEMKEFNENFAKSVYELQGEFEREIDDADHKVTIKITNASEINKQLNQDIKLKKNNFLTKNELKACEATQSRFCRDINYCQSYIGQVCWILQAIMYHIVLPDQFAEVWPYKVKDIEEDINDEDLLDDDERQEALKRWVDLKEKLSWEPSIEKALKMLQKEGNYMDNPESLTFEEAERVAEELDKQGRLKGRIAYEKVKQIIDMWRKSATLLQSLP